MRNALAHAGKSGRRVVSAFITTAFAQDTSEAASTQWRNVADQIRPKVPKLATLMDSAEQDVLAYMTFPKQHWAKLHSTNPISVPRKRSTVYDIDRMEDPSLMEEFAAHRSKRCCVGKWRLLCCELV